MQLRVDVFVVEQACIYHELDNLDVLPGTLHILGHSSRDLVAYARAMAPIEGDIAPAGCIKVGRVVVRPENRGQGIAREMLVRLIDQAVAQWPAHDVFLSAQTAAVAFYQSLGFHPVSAAYLEDGIEHIDMLCRKN